MHPCPFEHRYKVFARVRFSYTIVCTCLSHFGLDWVRIPRSFIDWTWGVVAPLTVRGSICLQAPAETRIVAYLVVSISMWSWAAVLHRVLWHGSNWVCSIPIAARTHCNIVHRFPSVHIDGWQPEGRKCHFGQNWVNDTTDIARSVPSLSQSGFALSLVMAEKKEILFFDVSAEADSQKVVTTTGWQPEGRTFYTGWQSEGCKCQVLTARWS